MFLRALMAFLALPGIVAGILPLTWLWVSSQTRVAHPTGIIVLTVGSGALLWCVRDFYVSGKGTLAPWEPPTRLVTVGFYRYSRNPMYIAVILILLGWALTFGSLSLLAYAVVVTISFHLRVIWAEEPWLARAHGGDWTAYASRVPRWLW